MTAPATERRRESGSLTRASASASATKLPKARPSDGARATKSLPKNLRNGTIVSGKAGRGRVVRNKATDGPSTLELTRAMYDQPTLWDMCDELPEKVTGGPRKLPEVMYLGGIGYQHIYGSFRRMQAELDEPAIWGEHVEIVATMQAIYRPEWPALDVKALKAKPPLTAQNIHDAYRSWAEPAMRTLESHFECNAADIAKAVGYGDPNGRGTLNAPVRERFITTDGKVTTAIGSPYRQLLPDEVDKGRKITTRTHVYCKATGTIVNAAGMPDAGVQLYNTGKGPAVGYKTISTALRNDLTNSTVVLTLRQQRTGAEAQEALDAIIDVNRRLDGGLLGAVMDAAGTGTHIRRLAREAGIVLVTPIKAKSVDDEGNREEKTQRVLSLEHQHRAGGTCTHTYYSHGGALAELVSDDNGNTMLRRFESGHIERRADKKGFRMYVGWTLTCRVGLQDHEPDVLLKEQRFNITAEPGADGFNVAENLRLVAPDTEAYRGVYGWRQDEESRNNNRDEAKRNRMARAHSAKRSFENEIGAAMVRNGLAARLHRERAALAAAA